MVKSFPSLVEQKLSGCGVGALAEQRWLPSVTLTDSPGFIPCPARVDPRLFSFRLPMENEMTTVWMNDA